MHMTLNRLFALISFSAVAIGAAACSDVETKIDCASVCNRYKDCYDKDYDTSDCKSRCDDYADDSTPRQDRLDACDDCMDDKSCTAATFACAAKCVGILP